jgi:Na+-translocating ferredoxin:NAD+ oxidoreductase RnfC subunit
MPEEGSEQKQEEKEIGKETPKPENTNKGKPRPDNSERMKREWAEIREWRRQKKEKEEQQKETTVDFKGSPAPVEEKKEDKKKDTKNNDGAMILIGISVIATIVIIMYLVSRYMANKDEKEVDMDAIDE